MYKTVTYIDREETKRLIQGWGTDVMEGEETLNGTEGEELLNARAVANAVVKRVHELDVDTQAQILSPERVNRGFVVGDEYPAHGVVVVDNIPMAHDVENFLNRKFDSERNKFPRSRGWRAVATHSKARQPFDKTHPFFHYLTTGRLTQNSARILVVVDRATEGMNNKYLTVMGIAKKSRSVLELVQRIGRLIRSAHYEKDGVLYAPPLAFDMVHIITHEKYGNQEKLEEALDFMRNMAGALSEMLDIDTYANEGIDVFDSDDSYTPQVSFEEMIIITDIVGEAIITGKRVPLVKIHNRIPTRKKAKRELVTQIARRLYDRNDQAAETVIKDLFRVSLPDGLSDVSIDDRIKMEPLTMDEAKEYIEKKRLDKMVNFHEFGTETWLEAVQQIYIAVEGQYYQGEMTSAQTVMATLDELATGVMTLLRIPGTKKAVVSNLVEAAALERLSNLGATLERIDDTGDLNIPAVVAELRETGWQAHVKRWVLWKLYEKGHLPNLAPFVELATKNAA